MLNHKGGNNTKGGFYLKKGEWEIVTVEGKNGPLPGGLECEYIKLPAILFVPLAMVMGALYVMFLPFIGFAMLFAMIAKKAAHGLRALAYPFAAKLAELLLEKGNG
jgi:hypothetical protein